MSTILRPDILIQSPTDEPLAIVEIKNRQNLSQHIATALRDQLLTYGYRARVPYFLLLSQDTGFLWKATRGAGPGDSPVAEFPMRPVIARYLPDLDAAERLRGAELSLIVLQWLRDLALGQHSATADPERLLERSGFLATIQDAVVTAEPQL